MDDYVPIDLGPFRNAGIEILGNAQSAPLGAQLFRGIPFRIGDGPQDCYLAFGNGSASDPLRIPLERDAHSVIVAHRLLESRLTAGAMVGEPVADYIFTFADGSDDRVVVRERFEIAVIPTRWGELPFLAVPDEHDQLPEREVGRFDAAGGRQTAISQAAAQGYYLWAWSNPHPDRRIASLTVLPRGPRFIIAAVTIGLSDEFPFVRSAAVPIRITVKDTAISALPFDLSVSVDRGTASFPFPLPALSAEAFAADAFAGWGQDANATASPATVDIAALSSATVRISQGTSDLGAFRWGDLETAKVVDTPRMRVEVAETGRNWVRTTVLDDATGLPVPCRIHFRSPTGLPYQPHGHHDRVNANMDTWHLDIGGDVRLGGISYAYIDGRCEGWLPRGEVLVDVARGFEYQPLRTSVRIEPGQQNLTLHLKRWCNMNAQRWFSGDTHVHFLSTQGGHTEARGEDLNVVNLLLSQWGHLFTNTEEFIGRPSASPDGRTIVYASQENRQHMLGHLTLLGLKHPVMPWCTDGPDEAEMGGSLEATMADWADRCHAQGGTVVLPHIPAPNGEPAALIATGRVDAVEFLKSGVVAPGERSPFNHLEYYRYLNGGYRLPLVGGTDKMTSGVPVGCYRTYVHIPDDQEFSYDNWCRNMALGRTFMSGGPIISFSVDGLMIGDTLHLQQNGGTVELVAVAESVLPIYCLEIVMNGKVVADTKVTSGTRRLELRERVAVNGNSWLAARVGGPHYGDAPRHHDDWKREVIAHTSPIYVACGGEWELFDPATAQYMITLIDGSLSYMRQLGRRHRQGTVTHHHGEADHQLYLERPFMEALEAIHRRMHEHGLAH